jgi:hypothetical protein
MKHEATKNEAANRRRSEAIKQRSDEETQREQIEVMSS